MIRFNDDHTKRIIFTARVTNSNIAHLNGHTATSREAVESAMRAMRAKLDETLWHRRFCHLGIGGINCLRTEKLVNGFNISCSVPFSRICKPCIHGKQHHDPFPKLASSRATRPLELMHSDLHGPLPVQTKSGY
ncbi:hypothetical protein BOTBODRAFT_120333 [Botryobasidium botryosum FD-172 SS1]|uniref:GAG-pre-integrase domain-containing protein n=1 Tax=Botryobasidium botryosum (strain FD-172 SS1) TaxID=930990 RepID=A0A067LV59_BOTB1|nr:hypothetical protein BOTBODRAFT_120333 [Botryobasidium botryosum FD-172 SS1]